MELIHCSVTSLRAELEHCYILLSRLFNQFWPSPVLSLALYINCPYGLLLESCHHKFRTALQGVTVQYEHLAVPYITLQDL